MVNTKFGKTIAVKFIECGHDLNGQQLESCLRQAAESVGAKFLGACNEDFQPQGATAVVMLSESHYALHTWPEVGAAVGSFHTCGEIDSMPAVRQVAGDLAAKRIEVGVYDYDNKNIKFWEEKLK